MKYPVNTLTQMARLPAEARERFLAELPSMLNMVGEFLQQQATTHGDVELILPEDAFTWVDDNKGEVRVSAEVQDVDGTRMADVNVTMPLKRERN